MTTIDHARRFYVATCLAQREKAARLIAALEAAGHRCTYNWPLHGSKESQPEAWPVVAQSELAGVYSAHGLIVLLPGGRGSHVELGCALGTNIPVLLVGSESDLIAGGYHCVFHYHRLVQRVAPTTDEELTHVAAAFIRSAPGLIRDLMA